MTSTYNNKNYDEDFTYRRRRIENYFCLIDAKHHPVLGMMTTIAYVDGYSTELGFENGMASVTFVVVGRFIEISNSINLELYSNCSPL